MTTATFFGQWEIVFNDTPTVDGGSNQIRWTAGAGTSNLQNVYGAIQDVVDNDTAGVGDYVQFGNPMQAITPTDFRIGQIFANDDDAWFIDPESIKHLTGGGLRTIGWTYSTGVRKGIFRVPMSSLGTIVAGDTGFTASNGTVTGTLLYVDTNTNELWIRPTNNTATHDWGSVSSGTVSVNGNSGTQGSAGLTGENIWSNIFTLGTLFDTPQLYVYQDSTLIANSEDSGAGLWWGTGNLDILVKTTQEDVLIDEGVVTVYARKVNTLYDHFVSNVADGGRNPIPLATGDDLNNQTVGAIPANGITIGFAGPYTADVNDDATNETYSIQIDCANNPLTDVYEYLKYETREGSTTQFAGLDGAEYIGATHRISYIGGALTGTISPGDEIVNDFGDLSGIVLSHNTTDEYIVVGNSIGNFPTVIAFTWTGPSGNVTNGAADIVISPTKQSPFGTFAGGRFFGAFGVYLTNVAGADLNRYQVIADDGVTYQEPIQVTFTLTGVQTDSEIRIYNDDLTTTRNTEITGTESSESTLRSVVIQNAGSGYTVNDKLTLVGGTFVTAAILNVDSVDGGGAITGVSVFNPGAGYTEEPSVPTTVTGGTGSSAAFVGTYRGDFSYTYTYSTDINITVVIFSLFAKEVRLLGLQLTDQNQSIPIQQNVERNYLIGSIP